MNMKKIVLAMALVSSVGSMAHAAGYVQVPPSVDPTVPTTATGKVTFVGSVNDTPCSIDPDSVDQTIQMGSVSAVALQGGKQATPVPFSIKLHDCSLATASTATVSFNGTAGAAGEGLDTTFAVVGTASNVGVGLHGLNGQALKPGDKDSARTLVEGDNELQFEAFMQGATTSSIVPGDFSAITNFTIEYN